MELNFDITKKPLCYEEILQLAKFMEKESEKFVMLTEGEDFLGKKIEYFGEFYNRDFNTLLFNLNNDIEHRELLTKIFNKFVKIERMNDTISIGKDFYVDTYVGHGRYDTRVSKESFDGYRVTFDLPEYWKGYLSVLEDKLDKEEEFMKLKQMMSNVEKRKRFEKMVEELEK